MGSTAGGRWWRARRRGRRRSRRRCRSAPPTFRRVWRGWDPVEVADHLSGLERERDQLRAALAESENLRGEQRDRLDRFEAIESELTRSIRLARQTGEAVIADAERRAAELLAAAQREVEALHDAGRARLAEEERSLDKLRMAVAAEAAMLKEIEQHLSTRLSRAAASLVEIVDRPGGLGPFSQATATLIEFAQLLQRTATSGTPVQVRVEVDDARGGPAAASRVDGRRRRSRGPRGRGGPRLQPLTQAPAVLGRSVVFGRAATVGDGDVPVHRYRGLDAPVGVRSGGMRTALAAHDDVLRGAVERHDGWLFKHTATGCARRSARLAPRSTRRSRGSGRSGCRCGWGWRPAKRLGGETTTSARA